MKIVNIHIPKTSGLSFSNSLKEHCRMIKDYNFGVGKDIHILFEHAKKLNDSINIKNYLNVECISGHIIPIQYKKLKDLNWKFITWLREPAQKLHSQYFYLKKNEHYKKNFTQIKKNIFLDLVLHENLTLEEFVLHPKVKNYYQRFFYEFPKENYYFIDIVENYESDLKYLSKLLNKDLKVLNLNINNKNKFYNVDDVLLKKIIDFHDEDYMLYNEILKISNNRKNDY